MSGFEVTGSRTNATMPMNNSTTNSTIGDTGWRIAHAEMFFMSALPRGSRRMRGATFTFSPSRRKPPAVVTTRSLPVRPAPMMTPASVVSADAAPRAARRDSRVDHVDVACPWRRRAPRSAAATGRSALLDHDRRRGRRRRAAAPDRASAQCGSHRGASPDRSRRRAGARGPRTACDRPDEADTPPAGRRSDCAISCSATWPRISTSPPLASAEQRIAARAGDLADFGLAREHRAVDRRDDARAVRAAPAPRRAARRRP